MVPFLALYAGSLLLAYVAGKEAAESQRRRGGAKQRAEAPPAADESFRHHVMFTRDFMEAGGCYQEFREAGRSCDEAAGAGDGDKVDACVRKTAALRRCMAAKEAFFGPYVQMMDEGIRENERTGYGKATAADGAKWRWMYNMRDN